ncbi:DNA-(apurinic or apyrimidinic site) lyase [Colletotrichum tofieldiae]|uniref:Apurinic-apyrimidinic endonuclease 1 n=1 Tax=Colletotrichum tofieldiae TaxID=708197 RepID=A0A166QQL9_9PEZI|nr:DNA-(apurinic or apyrimidinic site) lyase (apurinic endonuclease) [Colletotrichum tofieldiae]GKT55236.1 DNA-(apurinic or apyrimidinic site) lyase [Colletotrichum tofieldiae]GKT75476.1 DNA-(apurinic or apyrimidinic site) lyase [Colletotrichum tofieldiae]
MPPRTSARRKAQAVVETKVEETTTTTKTNGTKSTTVASTKTKTTTSKKPDAKRKAASDDEHESCGSCAEEEEEKPAKKRKTAAKGKAKKEDDMPLADRTAVSSLKKAMYIGAHVSGAGGVQNSIQNALNIGANAFALFLKSQRKWESPPLAADAKEQFVSLAKDNGYDAAAHVLPHGSYLVNLAQADADKAKQAYTSFIDDLKRCEQLGIKLYNFHPGNTGGASREEACGRIAAQLNTAHKATKKVITVLENMAGAGNVIGTKFEDLKQIIDKVEDKERVGVCIDTCHAFAAGYDLRTPEKFHETMKEFDEIVGNKYLKAFHLNDSKAPFASHRDLHANIGTGFLGLRAFHTLVNHEPFQDLPMVLETPIDHKDANGKTVEDKKVWADEIKLLERLIGMDADGKEFKDLEEQLQGKGEGERSKIQDQVDRKAEKDAKKGTKGARKGAAGKGKKKKVETDDESE